MEIFSKYHNNHDGKKNSDNGNENNTHVSGRISTWVQGKDAALFFLPWCNNP